MCREYGNHSSSKTIPHTFQRSARKKKDDMCEEEIQFCSKKYKLCREKYDMYARKKKYILCKWNKITCINTAIAEADRLPAACATNTWTATASLKVYFVKNIKKDTKEYQKILKEKLSKNVRPTFELELLPWKSKNIRKSKEEANKDRIRKKTPNNMKEEQESRRTRRERMKNKEGLLTRRRKKAENGNNCGQIVEEQITSRDCR